MKHPNQATLALHAGGDLGFFARWRLERHLAKCDECRSEVAAYEGMREIVPDLAEIPEVPWNRLAAEMRANIRLGLSAGECVRTGEVPLRDTPWFAGARAAVALASIVILSVTGLVLERPAPAPREEGMVVQSTARGIQIRKDGLTMSLFNNAAENRRVVYSSDAQGGMASLYVDDKGYVTINRVSAE